MSLTDNEEQARASEAVVDAARENQARVLSGSGSPKILVGGINLDECPNFHTRELIDLGASIVSVTLDQAHALRPDRLFCPADVPLSKAVSTLPKAWRPDFFWDPQVEQGHYLPVGTGDLECPTVVSFNHAHLGQALLHMQGMFDCVIAPSEFMAKWGDVTLPWGASWGSMEKRIQLFGRSPKGAARDIDVSCTIGSSVFGDESVRHAVIAEMQSISERRTDWNVVILHGAGLPDYFDVLRRSKVSINVGSWGAPMTYRPLEVIEQGAVLVHIDETGYGSRSPLADIFDDSWFVQATAAGLEDAIEQALLLQGHTAQTRSEVRERYSYARQYASMFEVAALATKREKRLSLTDWSRRAFAVNYLTGYKDLAQVHAWALTEDDKASAFNYRDDDWDVCLWKPRDREQFIRWQTDLARREEPHRETYKRYA